MSGVTRFGVSNLKLRPLTRNLKKTPITWPGQAINVFNRSTAGRHTADLHNLYVPAEGNNKTWDAFCYTQKSDKLTGYGLQMTVGRKKKLNI
ncbi:hypothetical protein GYMLUDRAFT_47134, partial [Collybiopsis luxurians FD-317 M1]